MNNFNWCYNPADYEANNRNIIAEGDYRVCITNAMPTVSKNGTEGLEITLKVNGHTSTLRHYIWFNPDQVQRTNQNLGSFYNSFQIPPEEQNSCEYWLDKKGAVRVAHSEYKGRTIAKVAFCIAHDKQDKLPDWPYDFTDDTTEVVDTIESRRAKFISSASQSAPFEGFHF